MNTRWLRVIASSFLLLVFSISGFAQETKKQKLYAATLDGTTGLFKTWDAENLQQWETNFTFGYDQFNRDPGQLTIGRAVAGAAVGIVDRFEIFGSMDVQRRITADDISYYNPAGAPLPARAPGGAKYFTQAAPFIDTPLSTGRGDIHVGAKVNLLSERRGNPLSFAIAGQGTIPGQTTPTGLRRGLSKGSYDTGVFVLLSKTASDLVRFHVNAGYNIVGDPEGSNIGFQDEFIYRFGAEFPVHSKVHFIAELVGNTYVGDDASPSLNPYRPLEVLGGVRFYPKPWLSLSGAYQASVHHADDRNEPAYNVQRGKYNGFVVQGTLGTRRNSPPTVNCVVGKNSILQDDVTTIRANASDPDGDALTYSWSASGGKVTGTGDTAEFSAAGVAPGTYTVTATVSDGSHTASCSSTITVTKRNGAPTATIEPATFSLLPGESVSLRCRAVDANNDALTYAWTVNGQKLAAEGPQVTFGSEGRNPGSYDVTCTVSDGEFTASATSKGTIQSKANQSPTINCQTTTVDVKSGSSVQLSASASDPDGDALTYSWSSPAGAVSGNSNTTTFNAAGVKAGSYTVSVTVNDGRGGTAACNITVKVSEVQVLSEFGAGSARVNNIQKQILQDLAVRLKNDSSLYVNVIAYTDDSKSETSKKGLAETRAKNVAAFLQEQGIDSSRVKTTDGGTRDRKADLELSVR
jgi:outer membrane protein OmpA-like peptidoglycan-associated protein